MSLTIRELTPADVPEWLRMRRALLPDDPGHEAEARAYFQRTRGEAVTLVAERPGHGLAGFVEVGTRGYAEGCDSQPVAHIEGWYVDPDVRRRGVGAALIRVAADWARSAGFRELGATRNWPTRSARRHTGHWGPRNWSGSCVTACHWSDDRPVLTVHADRSAST